MKHVSNVYGNIYTKKKLYDVDKLIKNNRII